MSGKVARTYPWVSVFPVPFAPGKVTWSARTRKQPNVKRSKQDERQQKWTLDHFTEWME